MNAIQLVAICKAAPLAEQIIIKGRKTPIISMLVPLGVLSSYHKALQSFGTVNVGYKTPYQESDGYPAIDWTRLILTT